MSSENFWHHAGISQIGEDNGSYTVRIPDRLFKDENIVELESDIYWAYEKHEEIIVISDNQLRHETYEPIDSTSFTKGRNGSYNCVIPKEFFEEYKGRGSPSVVPEVTQNVNLSADEWLHFVFNDRMTEGEVTSCYVMTETQFDARFSDSNAFDDAFANIPRFTN